MQCRGCTCPKVAKGTARVVIVQMYHIYKESLLEDGIRVRSARLHRLVRLVYQKTRCTKWGENPSTVHRYLRLEAEVELGGMQ